MNLFQEIHTFHKFSYFFHLHSFSLIPVFVFDDDIDVRYDALAFDRLWQGRCLDQTFQNPHCRHCSTQGEAIMMKDLSKRNMKKKTWEGI